MSQISHDHCPDCSAHRARSATGFCSALLPVFACAVCPVCLPKYAVLLTTLGAGFVLNQLSARVAAAFELAVALMLIALGARSIARSLRPSGQTLGDGQAVPRRVWTTARWPLLIGAVHGLAGSGALTALAMSTLPSLRIQILYIGLFGLGSVIGMAAMTAVASWPMHRVAERRYLARAVLGATGGFSAILGLSFAVLILSRFVAS
jgi:hypothetical protein